MTARSLPIRLAALLLAIAASGPATAADPEYRSVASVSQRRPLTEGERIERAIARLKPGMDRDAAAKALGLDRLVAVCTVYAPMSFGVSYYVGPNQQLLVHAALTKNGRCELESAELRRGGVAVATFPASK